MGHYSYIYQPKQRDGEPSLHPHLFKTEKFLTFEELIGVRVWCMGQFGAPGIFESDSRWCCSVNAALKHGAQAIVFRSESDALMFRMRWC